MSKVKKNYFYNLVYQVLLLITPLVTTPYVSRVLKAEGIGTYSFLTAFISYFLLFGCMGIATYGQREISYIQTDLKKRSDYFWSIQILAATLLMVALIIYVGVIFFFFNEKKLFYIGIIQIAAYLFDINWYFYGMEEFRLPIIRNIVIKLLSIVCIFLFVRAESDLCIYIFIMYGSLLLGNVSLWFILPQYVNRLNVKNLFPFRHFMGAFFLFLPTIAVQIYVNSDKLMLGSLTSSLIENGYYEQAQRIESLCLLIVASLGTVVAPRIGRLFADNEFNRIREILKKSASFSWMTSIPIAIGICCVSENFVPWFFGEGYEQVVSLLRVDAWIIVAIGISNVTGTQYLIPTQKQGCFTKSVIMGMIVNVILNFFLIPQFLSLGAAVATLIAEIVVSGIQIYYVRNVISIKELFLGSIKYWVAGGIMGVLVYHISSYLPSSVMSTFILVACGGIMYITCLVAFKDRFFMEMISIIYRRIKK